MARKVSVHFKEERIDRAAYIAETVGFGEIIQKERQFYKPGTFISIMETGVIVITDMDNVIITMYLAHPDEVKYLYQFYNWGRVPNWFWAKVKKNWSKGYIQNQPNYHYSKN